MGLKGSGMHPIASSMAVFLLGASILACLLFNLPVEHSEDIDGDGITDHFQEIEEDRELVMVDGEWSSEVVGRSSEMDAPSILLIGMLLLMVVPVITYTYLRKRPEIKRGSLERKEESQMLDIVRRLASFLEIDPSLQNAVRRTTASLPEGKKQLLFPLIWDPMTSGVTFDTAFDNFTAVWEVRSPLVGQALRSLGSSSRERDQERISVSVRRTMRSFDKGSRELIQEYARSLSGPSTALFAIGVLLPLMLATMIPLMGLSGSSLFMIGFLLWVMVPLGILFYGNRLVERRPMLKVAVVNQRRSRHGWLSYLLLALGLLVLGVTVLIDLGKFDMHIEMDSSSLTVLGILLSVSLMLSGVISMFDGSGDGEGTGDPPHHLLRRIGTYLEEGRSFESSLSRSVAAAEHKGLARPMPGDLDFIERSPPPMDHLLGTARNFSCAGPEAGGGAVKALAGHLEEMGSMERDISSRVRSTIGQMGITASLFAPLMIGSSVGIFKLMESSGSRTGQTASMIGGSMGSQVEVHQFMLLSAGYLLLLSMVTALTLYRLEKGKTTGGWKRVPRALLLSSTSFALSSILSSSLIG